MMLAVHRPGVNITARLFQQAGLIRYGMRRCRSSSIDCCQRPHRRRRSPPGDTRRSRDQVQTTTTDQVLSEWDQG